MRQFANLAGMFYVLIALLLPTVHCGIILHTWLTCKYRYRYKFFKALQCYLAGTPVPWRCEGYCYIAKCTGGAGNNLICHGRNTYCRNVEF
jgi:hypothetical protein